MDFKNLKVTYHAINRYRERTGCKKSEDYIRGQLRKWAQNGKEVYLKKKYRVRALLNHNIEPARYIKHDGYILVIVEDKVIKTMHYGTAKRWTEQKPE